MIQSTDFKKMLKIEFAPLLHKYGFKGNGFHYRKITVDHYIYCLWIQIDKYGEGCWMELGVTADFLPDTLGKPIDIKKVAAYDCEFRKRLSKQNDEMWLFSDTEYKVNQSIHAMINEFETHGLEYFKQFIGFPNPLALITIDDIENKSSLIKKVSGPLDLRLALTIARIHIFIGNKKEALKFCEWGLSKTGQSVGLIPYFQEIRQSCLI